jgi:glucuronokinase
MTMQLIRRTAYSRAGLLGNPSDGYHGKTISVIDRTHAAQVVLYDWPRLEIVPSQDDHSRFRSIGELARDVQLRGYYGGIRLVKAAIKRFYEYCVQNELPLHDRTFSIRYESNIPRQVGLAGSSAIIVATLRALKAFYDVEIPREVEPSLVLSVETGELGIAAGLQDRVIQVYEGIVYMDFSKDAMHTRNGLECGRYESLPLDRLPPLYIAYSAAAGSPTEVFHNNLKQRFEQGEPQVIEAMHRFARIAADGREALRAGDVEQLARLIDENFDTRRSICRLPREQIAMVEAARRAGASAKFCGSGGAIIGTYREESGFERLRRELSRLDCQVHKPRIAQNGS